ncbi:MAG TPA: glycosyl hydrolase [Catenuloplanes sp.]|jgi:hypothetical protein
MRNRTRTRLLHAVAVVGTTAFLGYAFLQQVDRSDVSNNVAQRSRASVAPSTQHPAPAAAPPVVDAVSLRKPNKKYLGVAMDGVPWSMADLKTFAKSVGKSPNLIGYFQQYGDPLDASNLEKIYAEGALPLIQVEPHKYPMAKIVSGATDDYLATLARDARRLNMPFVLSLGHEMNGDWYPWGTKGSTAAQFVAAWKRMHGAFAKAGATNVIFMWNPNIVNPRPAVDLAKLYPGDRYVDWVGVTGYYNAALGDRRIFATLFQPTLTKVRTFTDRPIFIAETGAAPSADKPKQMQDLFDSVESRPDVVGFLWFNYNKPGRNERNWKFDSDAQSKARFSELARRPTFGFPVR